MHRRVINRKTNSKPDLVFISLTRLHYGSDGRLRSFNPEMSAEEWTAFMDAFATVTVLARVESEFRDNEGYLLDPRLKVVAIPHYDGLLDYYRQRSQIKQLISKYIVASSTVYCIWVPNPLSLFVARKVKKLGAPLLVRVIGDSAGVAKAILPPPLNFIAAWRSTARAKASVKLADGVIYVTLSTLQSLYPPNEDAIVQARTDMKFSPELLEIPQKHPTRSEKTFSLVAVGSQQQNYKGHDLLIAATSNLQQKGYDVSLTLVGAGRLHNQLKSYAQELGLRNVSFVERVGSSVDVARFVSGFGLFVMPSRTEGMPKALLEAMAVGVLAIGSTVGGISEVLRDECLFEPNSVAALERSITRLIDDEELALRHKEAQAEMIEKIRRHYSGQEVIAAFLDTFITEKVAV